MTQSANIIYIRSVCFQKITEQTFQKINISNMQFFIISQSGAIDTPGNIYFFTSDGAFFMKRCDYSDGFIEKLLLMSSDWNLINLCFCDFLIIDPKIYKSFVRKLCAKNIRDFWFSTAIDIYRQSYEQD